MTSLAGMNVVSAGTALALLPFTSPLPALAYAVICASAIVHVGYKLALAKLYDRGDLGQAYPLARGFAPVMAAVIAYFSLGEAPEVPALAGILLIFAGLMLLAGESGSGRALRETSVLFAAIIGTAVLGERAGWKRYAAKRRRKSA